MDYSDLQQHLSQTDKPVILDFWASWCNPCLVTKPVVEKLAREYLGRVDFLAINADDSPDVLKEFRVLGIPTLLTLRDGKEISRLTGAQNEVNYRAFFEAAAEGKEFTTALSRFDRLLRLGGGILFVIAGIISGSWILVGSGIMLSFLGIYDRCPVWNTIKKKLRKN
jgi:thioredoxin